MGQVQTTAPASSMGCPGCRLVAFLPCASPAGHPDNSLSPKSKTSRLHVPPAWYMVLLGWHCVESALQPTGPFHQHSQEPLHPPMPSCLCCERLQQSSALRVCLVAPPPRLGVLLCAPHGGPQPAAPRLVELIHQIGRPPKAESCASAQYFDPTPLGHQRGAPGYGSEQENPNKHCLRTLPPAPQPCNPPCAQQPTVEPF